MSKAPALTDPPGDSRGTSEPWRTYCWGRIVFCFLSMYSVLKSTFFYIAAKLGVCLRDLVADYPTDSGMVLRHTILTNHSG